MRATLESLGMLAYLLLIGAVLSCAAALVGCEKKETLLELETPAGGVEVQRSQDGVEVEIETRDDEYKLESDARNR